jgi:hypothetical protein
MVNKTKTPTSIYSVDTDYINIASSSSGTVTLPSNYSIGAQGSNFNITGGSITGSATTGLWTSAGTTTYDFGSLNAGDAAIKLDVDGIKVKDGADIKLGDVSLKDFMKKMEERLALLTPNPKLEAEWDELKALGTKYRELEQHIKDKMKTWDILNSEDNSNK